MKALWLVVLALAAMPLAGCEAVAAMYSVTLWMSGVILVIIIWLVAVIAKKVCGG